MDAILDRVVMIGSRLGWIALMERDLPVRRMRGAGIDMGGWQTLRVWQIGLERGSAKTARSRHPFGRREVVRSRNRDWMVDSDMPRIRHEMTVRIVPLRSHDAGDALVGGTAAERVRLVAELSEMQWQLTGRPLPTYTRATMPIALVPLRGSGRST